MTQSVTLARAELRKAKEFIDIAETRALAVDGSVPPTRQMLSDGDFDKMARHFLKALEILTPKGTRGKALKRSMGERFYARR